MRINLTIGGATSIGTLDAGERGVDIAMPLAQKPSPALTCNHGLSARASKTRPRV